MMMYPHTSRGRRSLRIGAGLIAVAALGLSACSKAAELGTEKLIESQSGGDVDLDLNGEGGFSIDTGEGGISIDEDGNLVITDESGEVVTGNVDGESGELNIESEDGEFRVDSGGDIPPEWPSVIPQPTIDIVTSSIQSTADELVITLAATAEADFVEDYGAALEAAGFERTSTFESTGNIMRTYDDGQWTVSVNSFGEGADAQASVSVFNSTNG